MEQRSLARVVGGLLVLEALLLFVPVVILGQAIDWPASLGAPPDLMLPLIAQQADAVRAGYLAYLAYSILFWPVALLTARVVAGSDALSPALRIAAGFGVASAVARTIGIIRWLVAMPALAAIYNDPATTDAQRAAVEVSYQALNAYGGSIGELLGVSLFAACWLAIVALVILRTAALPRWLGAFGLLAALALATNMVELFGVDLGALITVSTSLLQLWLLAAGVTLLARGPRRAPALAPAQPRP
jgi:hypothetical protein